LGLAFFAVPLILLYFTRLRHLPYPGLLFAFTLVLLGCGIVHILESIEYRYPLYQFAGLMKLLTAVAAWVAILALIPLIPKLTEPLSNRLPTERGVTDTTLHRLAAPTIWNRWNEYAIANLVALVILLCRALLEPLVENDYLFVLALLGVVYVSWRSGFGPGIVTLLTSMVGMVFFFLPARLPFEATKFGDVLAIAMFFVCGVCCSALGEAQWIARRRAKAALSVALERKAALEVEVTRRREAEFATRLREADLTELTRKLLAAQKQTVEALAQVESLVLNAPVGIALLDPELQVVRANRALFEGTQQSLVDQVGKSIRESVPRFPPELLNECEMVLQTGQSALDHQVTIRSETNFDTIWQVGVFPVIGVDGRSIGLGLIGQNVTERERVADALRESEERFRSMADSVPVLIWVTDKDPGRKYFNKTWLEFTGRPVEKEVGDGWTTNLHPDDRDRYIELYNEAFTARTPFELEYQLRRHDGEYRYVLARGTPRFTPAGVFSGFCGLCLDVTDRKAAEEAVARSERNLADFFENANVGLHWGAADGTILRANRAELDMLGYTREEYIGHPLSVFHIDREALDDMFAHLTQGERVDNYPARLRCKDGSTRDVLISSTALWEEGRLIHTRSFTRDITEHKKVEENLRSSEARYRTLTEAIPQLVWNATPDGNATFFNKRWRDYTGLSLEQSQGLGWLDAIHTDDRERIRVAWQSAIQTINKDHRDRFSRGDSDEYTFTGEFRLRRAVDDAYRWMLMSAISLRDSSGATIEWVGSIADIDDQKRQAENLEKMVHERTHALIDEVEERKRIELQLREVGVELTRSNRELEQFAYVASHDLQEPLRKIQAFGDRLRTRFSEVLPEAGKEYVERMHVSAARMRRLIDDLLTFSRVTTQARPFVRVDLGKLAQEVISDLDEYINQNGGQIEVANLPAINADPTQMRQLFQNLIANAIKFHRPNVPPRIEVQGELINEKYSSAVDEPSPTCRIRVRDNGIGFDEKYSDRIFQVFQRLHGRDEYEGTGVGLAICRKIVERHGGTITAQSQVGQGTTFIVTLPIRQSAEEQIHDVRINQEANHHFDGRR
jgi:PAS domain S-box-containing protein